MIIHVLIALFTSFLLYVSQPGTTLFSWHPALMTLAVAVFLFEGVLQFSSQNSFLRSFTRPVKVTAHWILQTTGLVLLLIGFAVIFYNKSSHNSPHFTTWHGLFGIITVVLVLIASSGGFMAKNYHLIPPTMNVASIKYIHALAGMVTLICASTTLLLGLYSNWFAAQVILPIQLAVAMFPIAFGLTVVIQISQHYFPALWK